MSLLAESPVAELNIGYYAHHHGAGHVTRALAIAAAFDGPLTLFGSRLPERVALPNVQLCPLPPDVAAALRAVATEREPFVIRKTEIFVNYQDGLGRSSLAEKFAAVVRVSATTRTIGTVTKVLALCDRTAEQPG